MTVGTRYNEQIWVSPNYDGHVS